MATVYLPYGYPQQEGTFNNVVYQGTVARLYVLPVDPRTENQNFERRLLSDVSKMRASAGSWAKSAWRLVYGTKASSIIYQLVKGDVDGYWSAGLDHWNAQSESWRNLWRVSSPFEVTYNDPGEVFFRLAYVLFNWETNDEGSLFKQPNPVIASAADQKAWWRADEDVYVWGEWSAITRDYDDLDLLWTYLGTWTWEANVGAMGGGWRATTQPGAYAEIALQGKVFQVVYTIDTDGAPFEIRMNGAQIGTRNTGGTFLVGDIWGDVYRVWTERIYRLVHIGTAAQKFRLEGVRMLLAHNWLDDKVVYGSWQAYSTGQGFGSDGYESIGSGARAIEFTFRGRWMRFHFKKGTTMGALRVIVDGEQFGDLIDQYNPSTIFTNVMIGPFVKQVHYCRMEAAAAGQINFDRVYVLSKKNI